MLEMSAFSFDACGKTVRKCVPLGRSWL